MKTSLILILAASLGACAELPGEEDWFAMPVTETQAVAEPVASGSAHSDRDLALADMAPKTEFLEPEAADSEAAAALDAEAAEAEEASSEAFAGIKDHQLAPEDAFGGARVEKPAVAAAHAAGDQGDVGNRPGLFGDALGGVVAPAAAGKALTALRALEAVTAAVGINIYASSTIAASPAFERAVTPPGGAVPRETMVASICMEARLFCFYSKEFNALSVYDPAEFHRAQPLYVSNPDAFPLMP